jgi:hypothetical protein
VLGALTSTSAVVSATKPGSTAAYYAPLAAELDSLPAAGEHRLELVSTGHAAYAALLGHAVLARGWETQQDLALNRELLSPTLDTGRYRAWLDDNAVGYVALSVPSISSPEVRVISAARAGYLREIWRSAHWRLYAVLHPTPIVSSPAVLTAVTQAGMTVQVPCACRVLVRVRWSKYLTATARVPAGTPDDLADSYRATLARDGSGWTALTSARAGTYQLSGTLLPA